MLTGDLSHDGIPEMIALYTIDGQRGANLHIQYLAVFVRKDGKLVLFTRAEVGGKGSCSVEMVSIQDSVIRLDTLDYGPQEAACCPSQKGHTSYVLTGDRLKEQANRTTNRK